MYEKCINGGDKTETVVDRLLRKPDLNWCTCARTRRICQLVVFCNVTSDASTTKV